MSCDFNSFSNPNTGAESRLSQLLFNRLNNNKQELVRIYGTANEESFKKWFKENGGFEYTIDDIDGRKISKLINGVNEYQSKFEFRVEKNKTISNSKLTIFPTIDMEKHAISILTDMYLQAEDKLLSKRMEITKDNVKKVFLASLKNHITNTTNLTKNQREYCIKIAKSLLANNDLLDRILIQPKSLNLSKSLNLLDAETTSDNENVSFKDIMNDEAYAKDWSDSIGEKRSIDKTISKEVRRIFELTRNINSIEKVNGKQIYDFANNTYSGIAETINFNDYLRSIYNYANFDNIESFVKSLHDIARLYPNRMALEQIADKCDSDYNIANLLYVNFNQANIKRGEFSINAIGNTVKLSNPNSNTSLVLRNTILSRINNSLGSNFNYLNNWINNIKFNIDKNIFDKEITFNKNIKFNNAEQSIKEIYNFLDLGIDENTINSYIANNEESYENKIKFLFNNISSLVDNINTAIAANNYNINLEKEAYKRWYKDSIQAQEAGLPKPEKYTISDAEKQIVINKQFESLILSTSEVFSKYKDVKTEFNSKNIEGELVSDTIKQSYLTRFFQRLSNENAAEQYFQIKSKYSQYIKSNILFEQLDKNGNIIIPGLLRLGDDNNLRLTPYYKMLDYQLFNGAKNEITENVATYTSMSKSDFDITAYGLYLNNGYRNSIKVSPKSNIELKLAKYFIQTPSDAPKTFIIDSYKLSYNGLEKQDGTINRNHPIYIGLKNIIEQEIIDMREAFNNMFVLDENNKIVYEEDTINNFGNPIRKPKLKKDLKDLYKQYHYNGNSVIDNKGNLTGNVFEFWNILLDYNNKTDNLYNINNYINKDVESMYSFLYGGENNNFNNFINEYLDNYIKVKTNEAVSYFNNYKNDIINYSEETVKEFALNYTIQYVNFTNLFSGNTKFYKNTRDTIKRNKEIQGSGLIYASYDINNINKKITTLSIGNKSIDINNTFKYITVKSVNKPSTEIDGIKKRMEDSNTPKDIIDFIIGKYSKDSTANDAQSYITLDEFVKRVYLSGEYENYKDTIEQLYDENKPIDYDKLGKLIQVQKNFYYNLSHDNDNNLEVPIQIKNAEFVLIPRFLGDSELSKVYNIMTDNGIGQLNTADTEKAGQTKVLTLWDNNGTINEKDFNNFITNLNSSIKTGDYSALYKQQDTPQHMDDENKAGVQIVKKLLDNLKGEKGQEYRNKFFRLFTTNIEDSFSSLIKELGVSTDKYGNIEFTEDGEIYYIDKTKFYNLILGEFSRLGVDSNMMQFATLNEINEPNMPNYMPMVRKKIMSIFQSIFTSNVTRQTLPGFHAAQISNIGFQKSYGQSKYESVTGDIHRKLRYHPDGADYIEVLIPRWSNKLKTLYNEDGTVKQEFTIEDLEKAGLTDMIGYRIPTEGKQSVVKMKVVGFLDYTQGSTIVVPDEFVTQTGSDFDIDSVYGIYHEFYVSNGKLHKVEYNSNNDLNSIKKRYINYINRLNLKSDLSAQDLLNITLETDNLEADFKTAELLSNKNNNINFEDFSKLPIEKQNSREARNNEILDTFLSIMSDNQTSEENFMSSNFDDIVKAKQSIYEILGLNKEWIDINSFIGQSNYRNQVMSGATLKAISVKRDGFCSISNVSHTTINDKNAVVVEYPIGQSPVERIINYYSNIYGKDSILGIVERDNKQYIQIKHNKLGWSLNNDRNAEGKLLTVYSSETTALILDGVKEGGIMNVNTYTFDVFKTLIDVGIDYETAIAFICQDGISEIVTQNDATNSIYNNSKFNPIGAATRQLVLNYLGGETEFNKYAKLKDLLNKIGIEDSDYKGKPLNKELLKKQLSNITKKEEYSKEDLINQLAVIDMFRRYKLLSDEISNHANVLNTDKFGAGQSIFEVNKLINNIKILSRKQDAVLFSDINNKKLIDAIYPNTEFEHIDNIMESVYPSLYAQLKYSALGSTIITSNMFLTESKDFKYIKKLLPNEIDEATNYAFENYIINKSLNENDFIQSNILVDENGIIINNVTSTDETGLENRRRIFGYRQPIVYDFDFTNYNKDNIDKFMMLSPANKIMLLKSKVKGESIFDYLETELIDSRKINKGLQSPHRIIVKDNSTDIEQLIELFRNLYYNSNPYFKLAAQDMIRYSVVVEGLNYNYNFVSKIIPAEILYNNYNNKGVNLVSSTNKYLNEYIRNKIDNNVIDDFFKQYNNSSYIPKYVNKRSKKYPNGAIAFDIFGSDIAIINLNIAEEIGVLTRRKEDVYGNETNVFKRYIKTNKYKKGVKNPELSLYKVVPNGNIVYLLPVNRLERNEIGHISVNSDNNIYPDVNLYMSFANNAKYGEYILPNNLNSLEKARNNIGRNYVLMTFTGDNTNILLNRYKDLVTNYTIDDNSISPDKTDFTVFINNNNLTRNVQNGIIKAINNNSKLIFYDNNNAIRTIEFIESKGYSNYEVIGYDKNSATYKYINELNINDALKNKQKIEEEYKAQMVKLNENTGAYKQFRLKMEGTTESLSLINRVIQQGINYASMTSQMASTLGLLENKSSIMNINNQDFLLTNIGYVNNKTVKYLTDYLNNKDLVEQVVKQATNKDKYAHTNLIKIELYEDAINNEVENQEFLSSIEEVDNNINNFITNQAKSINTILRQGDSKIAQDVKNKFRLLGIDRNNKENLNDPIRATALSTTALFIEQHSNYLTNKFNKFYTDNEGKVYSITDKKLYDVMLDNPELQQRFTQLLLDISTFISDNDVINTLDKYSQNEIDKAETEKEKRALLDSNNSIETIKNLYNSVSSLRNRANFARDLFFDKVISKISTNPLIKAELQSIIKPYKDEGGVASWITDAQESNVAIIQVVLKEVMNNLRTAELNATDRVNDFKNKLKELQSINPNISIASIIDENGKLILPYTKELEDDIRKYRENISIAKLKFGSISEEYHKAKQDYEKLLTDNIEREFVYEYYKDSINVEKILDKYPDARKEIKEIRLQQHEILSNLVNNDYSTLSNEEIKELKRLAKKLNNLRKSIDLITGDTVVDYDKAVAIDRYLTGLDSIRKKYYETNPKLGFAEKLKSNLDTINSLEVRLSQKELDESIEYQNAKRWINTNTYIKVDEDYFKEIDNAFKTLKSFASDDSTFSKLSEDKKDFEGIINGNLFNENEIKLIKIRQNGGNKAEDTSDGVERLIRNRNKLSDVILKPDFFIHFRGNKNTVSRNKKIKEANAILIKYLIPQTGIIQTSDMTIEDMQKLDRLYTDLKILDKFERKDISEMTVQDKIEANARKMFIENNVDFIYNNEEYNRQRLLAEQKGRQYLIAWEKLNYQFNEIEKQMRPNFYLYGYMSPKNIAKWIDEERTNAKDIINKNIEFKTTKYYEQRLREELNKPKEEFEKWYELNHVFNPNTQRYEPIRIWQQMEYKDKSKISYEPKSKWIETKIKDEYKNNKYEQGKIILNNANPRYVNKEYNKILNDEAHKKLYNLVTSTLDELVINKRSKSYINKGYIPSEPIKKTKEGWRDYADSILRSMGMYDVPMKSEIEEEFGKRNVNMPMLHRQQQLPLLKIRNKAEDETNEEYAEYVSQVYKENKKILEENNKAHIDNTNKNYEEVFANFIKEAIKFNSIQESSLLMRLTLEELRNFNYFKRNSKGQIMYDNAKSYITGQKEAARTIGSNAVKHFEFQMKKLIYNEFELDEGYKSKISRVARSLTSAKFMMLNITGGISNITTGESQILMETFAKEFLGNSDYTKGLIEYKKGLFSYINNSNNEKSDNLTDAIIKRIDVLNLDSQTDIAGNEESDLARKLMNYAYFQQSAGEHMMQNSTMLGMMYSHRVLKDSVGKSKLVTFEQYTRDIREQVLKDIIKNYDNTSNTNLSLKFEQFVNSLKEQGNEEELQKYVYFTKDIVTEFVNTLPLELKKSFIDELKNRTSNAKKEFEGLPLFIDQMELVDGIAQLKKDSGLTNKDIANFRNKVIAVNHKIHGIYDKIGAARAQSTWWGGIAFQFHKHIIPGWAKRYGYIFGKGIYNEAREAVDKGSYISLYEFLKTPFINKFNKSEITEEVKGVEAWRNFGNNIGNFLVNWKIYYNILPEYDKANLRRTAAEICGTISAMLLFIGARMMWDEREEDTQLADYLIYTSDRLASEIQQYTPVGAIQEGKKLYSNPLAAFANVKEAFNMFGAITDYMFTGDENSLYYQSGTNVGKNKLTYNLQKQVPIYNQYLKHERLGKNNSYFKTGNNILGFLPIRDWVDGWK